MNFFDARAISKVNQLHIRRTTWPDDKWFIIWRGLWFAFNAGVCTPVRGTDYDADDLRATDWTTVPAPLVACPITPTAPIGGTPPVPGSPGFPFDPFSPPDGGTPYVPGGAGGDPDGDPDDPKPPKKLPKPDSVQLTVQFDGVNNSPADSGITGVQLKNIPWSLQYAGGNTWRTTANSGFLQTTPPTPMVWAITVVKNPRSYLPNDTGYLTYKVTALSTTLSADPTHSPFSYFTTADGTEKLKGVPIPNANEPGDGWAYGGTATVS